MEVAGIEPAVLAGPRLRVALNQGEGEPRTAFGSSAGVIDQMWGNVRGLDDRKSPWVHPYGLGQKLSTHPVTVTGNRIDDEHDSSPFHRI